MLEVLGQIWRENRAQAWPVATTHTAFCEQVRLGSCPGRGWRRKAPGASFPGKAVAVPIGDVAENKVSYDSLYVMTCAYSSLCGTSLEEENLTSGAPRGDKGEGEIGRHLCPGSWDYYRKAGHRTGEKVP